ncbi:MAG: glucose-6-phosphate dehydrogenase, partial [bacterium]
KMHATDLNFHYKELSDIKLPEAYERLLLDCMQGDSTLFSHGLAIEETWKFIQPILNAWKTKSKIELYPYSAGTWGPSIINRLFDNEEMTWRYPCRNDLYDQSLCEL